MAGSDELWVGVDVGTQSARVLVAAGTGEVLGLGSHPLTSLRNGVRHEQDPHDWVMAAVAAARAALRNIPATSVRGMAVCSTSGTVVVTDEAGIPRTPGLMYDDGRAGTQVINGPVAGEGLRSPRPPPSWPLAKLAWLRQHHPGVFQEGSRLGHQADLVAAHFAGHPVPTDWSHALKTGYNLRTLSWPEAVLEALSVPASFLPPVVEPGTLLGQVAASVAKETGIPAGTPIYAGMTDGCAGQVAAGALSVGNWNSVLGTTVVIKGVSARSIRDEAGTVYSHRSPDGLWLPGGASSAGAGILTASFPKADLLGLDRAASTREPAAALAYPLLGSGERFPFVAAGAHAFIIGEPTDEVDRYAAMLQGVAYIERLSLACMAYRGAPRLSELSFTGGASRSRYWNQLRVDVLGHAAHVPQCPEAAFGMAVMAAYGATKARTHHPDENKADKAAHPIRLAEVASRMVRSREIIKPRTDHADRFTEPYLRLLSELERRSWLPGDLAAFARTLV